ncbi:MAG: AAA family ATPase [Bryobacteraceae bacterium]|nr:AAA family ATPase [Bryobacteraceae bacterium]
MLTRILIRNFKRFAEVEIPLGNPVVFVGPNNSGKSTALQALTLWHVGVQRWLEKRGEEVPEKRPGVTINRRDLVAVPVPSANLLWRDLHVREMQRAAGKLKTQNIRIEIEVEGVTGLSPWKCGLEFDYANEESIYCRPLRSAEGRMPVPREAGEVKVAYLPPMSGLASQEVRLDVGAVNVRIGEGRTAEVLRNLCYRLVSEPAFAGRWEQLARHIGTLFLVELREPKYIPERGEITMAYREQGRRYDLDISAAGRGLHQVLLVLAYLYANPGAVLLLDEPDAHLEILRQRQIYRVLVEVAAQQNSQVIAASHSEVLLNEAADRHLVVAFVGRPHPLANRGSQVYKALRSYGFEHYYQAETQGWVLYLEGSTDLAVLRAFARLLHHPAEQHLERPFVHYVQNQPQRARDHFFALREAKPDLVAVALFDRLETRPRSEDDLTMLVWERREIENYLVSPEALLAWAGESQPALFAEAARKVMQECLDDLIPRVALSDRSHRWWSEQRASEFLDELFREYFKRQGLPNLMDKNDYHELVRYLDPAAVSEEVIEKLDAIQQVAQRALPAEWEPA